MSARPSRFRWYTLALLGRVWRLLWNRWARRVYVGLVVLLLVTTFGGREALRLGGERELDRVTAELDASDPGWRLDAIQAERDRTIPSPAENGAELVRAATAEFAHDDQVGFTPEGHPITARRVIPPVRWHDGPPENVLPRADELADLAAGLARFEPALRHARKLHTRPRGGTRIDFPDLAFAVPIPHVQDARGVAQLLRCEADLAAVAGDGPTAADRVIGVMNAGRSIGDEPLLISQLVRLAMGKAAARSAVQVLAWAELSDPDVARVQAALVAEYHEPILLWAARGERAVGHASIEALRDGRADRTVAAMGAVPDRSPDARLLRWLNRGTVPADEAAHLRTATEFVRLAGLPPHERLAAAERWEADLRALTRDSLVSRARYHLTGLLTPAVEAVIRGDAHGRIDLGCAAALLGCERFRLRHGRWPGTLDELPADLRPLVPTDPYTGRPVVYRRLPNGVAVYSVGPDRADDGGTFDHTADKRHGPDIGFRLWDVGARRQPAPPPPVEETPPTPEEP